MYDCGVLKGTVKVYIGLQRYKPIFRRKHQVTYLSVDTFQGVYVVSVLEPICDMTGTMFTGLDAVGHGDNSTQIPLDLGAKITKATFRLLRIRESIEETRRETDNRLS